MNTRGYDDVGDDGLMGTLYLVALPIGNLADITLRALDVLRSVAFIIAEDTRTTGRLLKHHGINTRFHSSLYQGAERRRIAAILRMLRAGNDLALVSDAGTPLISDPGYPLVRTVLDAGGNVVPVPGPTAAIAALVASGLPTSRFCFEGSVPRKSGDLQTWLDRVTREARTTVVYESPHRLLATLGAISDRLPARRVVVARELTKSHEEFLRGTASEILSMFEARGGVRGESVLLIEGIAEERPGYDPRTVAKLLALLDEEGASNKTAVGILMLAFGMPRNDAYALVHRRK